VPMSMKGVKGTPTTLRRAHMAKHGAGLRMRGQVSKGVAAGCGASPDPVGGGNSRLHLDRGDDACLRQLDHVGSLQLATHEQPERDIESIGQRIKEADEPVDRFPHCVRETEEHKVVGSRLPQSGEQ
jgi:hypothetical protein